VLTGVGTILADDPALNVRIAESDRQPLRVILDSRLRTPSDSRVINREGGVLVIGVHDDPERRRSLELQGVEVVILPAVDGRADLRQVLSLLGERGANEIWLEAGATLAGACIGAGLFDELVVYLAPTLLGPQSRALAEIPALATLDQRLQLRFTSQRQVGDDLCLTLARS
jgi:diaminohydroxyphosphoribosylaminopyrimidine deaminase/5-amino-6-(5-phosphoribosylamino)uracil reductase